MITLSEFVVIGIIEVVTLLLLGIGALFFYNHKLHKKGKSLATQLHQLKDTTRFLLDKVNEFGSITYSSFLNKEIEDAKESVSDFFDGQELHFASEQTCEDKAAIMRYLLLEAERAADQEEDEETRQSVRNSKLNYIVNDFEHSTVHEEAESNDGIDVNPEDFKQKWGYLCDAAMSLIHQRTFQSEEDLIHIVRVLNEDLALEPLEIPERSQLKSSQTIEQIKREADRSRDIISKLLSERNAAEAEIGVKVEELEKLQRFLKESEQCMQLMESELQDAKQALEQKNRASEAPSELQMLVERSQRENAELMICIETLESDNLELKNQLGISE